ncbi:class F sortase [Streptomyces sp. CA-111067]|uniref:class F sortase n=1 Tax=Streptomyces sp. CA-111067 TaxID=3240046 RepID=UPI003D961E01
MSDDAAQPADRDDRDDRADRTGHSRRTAVALVVLAVLCVAGGLTAVAVGTSGGGASPPPQPGPAAAGQPTHSMDPGMDPSMDPGMDPSMGGSAPAVPGPSAGTPSATAPTGGGSALPASRPTELAIPSIGVHGALLDLGQNKDGSVQVPGKPLQAGWFHGSPTPGQVGPSVILGHVDSYATGPAVFYKLGAMKPHQQIRVTRADGKVAVFSVDSVRSYAKKDFPTLDVYGNTPDPQLRLITCGDWNARTHAYDGNIVVFAHLTH